MRMPHSLRRWLCPSRVALILGLGALPAAVSQADTPGQDNFTVAGDTVIRSEGGRIFLSEAGRESELRLSATPERDRLLRLLEKHGASGVKLDRDPRLIMSGGGGTGFSLRDIQRSIKGDPPPSTRDPPPPALQKPNPAGRERKPATDKKG